MANWFDDQRGPESATTDQVTALYQELLGRAPENDAIVQSWVNGTGAGGIDAVRAAIAGSPEAKAFAARPPAAAPPPAAGGGDTRQFVLDAFAAKGLKPRDDADLQYWVNHIDATGGLADAGNKSWWQSRMAQGQGGVGDYLERPEASATTAPGTPLSNIGGGPPAAPTATTFAPPAAPAYTNYNPGPAPAVIPYTLPTLDEARQAPGFQSAIENADLGIQRSAIAKSGLSGGLLKDLSAYNIGLADQNYNSLVNQTLAANQANNGQNLSAYIAQSNAGIGAGNLNLSGTNQQFTNTYQPTWQSYLSNVGQQQFGANHGLSLANFGLNANQQQFGQTLARDQFNLGAQGQYFDQGLASNKNAFDQYDRNQNTAFDQWYKLFQAGNPGNPYV